MNDLRRLKPVATLMLLGLAAIAGIASSATRAASTTAAAPASDKGRHYVCAPCGMACDAKVYDHPGTCPVCGGGLVDQQAAKAAKDSEQAKRKVAILIFDGVEIIDFTGPWEVFGGAGFDIYTVAEKRDPVTTAGGMTVIPNYTFADAPHPDVLLVPGGDVHGPRASATTLKWVADETARADHTLSVCNGAFILASAGLLDGLSATTTAHLIDTLRADYPRIRVVDDQRFVDNGRIITAAGLSSGIDGALHVVATILGNGVAQADALGIEYDWRPGAGFARAALADRLIPEIGLDALGKWDLLRTEGDTDRWELAARLTSDLSGADILDHIGRALATEGSWTKVGSAASPTSSEWKFSDRAGRPWTGTLTIKRVPGDHHQYTARLIIATRPSPRASVHRPTDYLIE